MKKIKIFGVKVHDFIFSNFFPDLLNQNERTVRICVTPNIDHFMRLTIDNSFASAYSSADYIFCDSRVAAKLYFLRHGMHINVMPGSDLTKYIFDSKDFSHKSFCIIGSTDVCLQNFKSLYSHIKISSYSPPYGFIKSNDEILKILNFIDENSNLDYIFLALGSPQQEILASKIKKIFGRHRNFTIFCIGASIDFLSGEQTRAPLFLQKMGMEWFFRLLTNPIRLAPRYFSNFIWLLKNWKNI